MTEKAKRGLSGNEGIVLVHLNGIRNPILLEDLFIDLYPLSWEVAVETLGDLVKRDFVYSPTTITYMITDEGREACNHLVHGRKALAETPPTAIEAAGDVGLHALYHDYVVASHEDYRGALDYAAWVEIQARNAMRENAQLTARLQDAERRIAAAMAIEAMEEIKGRVVMARIYNAARDEFRKLLSGSGEGGA